jgi:hypothetical protein
MVEGVEAEVAAVAVAEASSPRDLRRKLLVSNE